MEDLWKLRKRKRMTIGELSGRSGVPTKTLRRYELGEISISLDDLDKLARALYVEPWEIKLKSDAPPPQPEENSPPRPAPSSPENSRGPENSAPFGNRPQPSRPFQQTEDRPRTAPSPRPPDSRPPFRQRAERPPLEPGPIRSSQLNHITSLARRLGLEIAGLEAEIGSSVAQLNRRDASRLLGKLQSRIMEEHPARPKNKRQRPYLPESVDEFEYKYLTQVQESKDILEFKMFDGASVSGHVMGFSPYSITVGTASGEELTLQKLAIAYYKRVPTETSS